MHFTTDEIDHITTLAYHRDLTNVALALALLQGSPWLDEWRTPLYWMYNRYRWANQPKQALQVEAHFLEHVPELTQLPPLLVTTAWITPKTKPTLSPKFESQIPTLGVDLPLLAQLLFEHYPLGKVPINSFLFRHGTAAMQTQLLPYVGYRLSTGLHVLNLGGFQLDEFPSSIFTQTDVQHLELWGNHFQTLPDQWDSFPKLQQVNLAGNQLSTLPPSFLQLPQLERLHLQDNHFKWDTLLELLRRMPHLQQLVVAPGSPYDDPSPLHLIEQLVHFGLLRQPPLLQEVFLSLSSQDLPQPRPLPSSEALLQAISSGVEPLPRLVRQHLLQQSAKLYRGTLPPQASIAVLGMVAYATRLAVEALSQNWEFTTQLTTRTTHIVLGESPEWQGPVEDKPYLFLSEKQVQELAL